MAASDSSKSDGDAGSMDAGAGSTPMADIWGALHFRTEATILLKKSTVTIGRANSNDIVIPDKRISAKHCQITHTFTTHRTPNFLPPPPSADGGQQRSSGAETTRLLSQVEIEDFSRNGTYVNGHPLIPGIKFTLGSGDIITVLWELGAQENEAILYTFENLTRLEEVSPLHHLTQNRFAMVQELGKGAFATVYLAKSLDTSATSTTPPSVAIKVIDKHVFFRTGQDVSVLCREAVLMKDLQHPNIVRTFETFDTPRNLAIVLEYLSGGDLFDCVSKIGPLPERKARNIFGQVLHAVEYLHKQGIVHRDIKPENILLVNSYHPHADTHIKLADFGLAKSTGPTGQLLTACGTYVYLAPEALQNYLLRAAGQTPPGYGSEVDMWAVGIVLYFLLSAMLPFAEPQDASMPSLEVQISTARFSFSASVWSLCSAECKSLIQSLLHPFPQSRHTAEQALKVPWFSIDLTTPRFETASTVGDGQVQQGPAMPRAIILGEDTGPYRQKTYHRTSAASAHKLPSDTESDSHRIKRSRKR